MLIVHMNLSVIWCGSKNGYQKTHLNKRDSTLSSKYNDHSKFGSQDNWGGGRRGDLYDYLMCMNILHFNNE